MRFSVDDRIIRPIGQLHLDLNKAATVVTITDAREAPNGHGVYRVEWQRTDKPHAHHSSEESDFTLREYYHVKG